jgi:superfamily II DNA or RNA helicase
MATGGGKTPTAMRLADMSIEQGLPVLWIAHRTELIDQAIDKAQQVAPSRRIGRFQGRVRQWRSDLVVGSIQTVSTEASLNVLGSRRWGLIVIDETHHATAATYRRVLDRLGCYGEAGPLVLGVTATLDRADGASLGEIFESVADPRIGLLDLIRSTPPYLVPPRGIRVKIDDLDLGAVRQTAGDLNAGQLGAAMAAAMAPQKIVEAWIEHAKGRPTIAFLPTVAISIEQAEAFNQAGIVAVHLDGTTAAADRATALDEFREGKIEVLCNVGLFTEGTDLPSVACVVLGRPTSSGSLYQQMVGRGLRLHPGKADCIILDVTGVTGRHRLATMASLDGAPSPEKIPDELLLYEDEQVDDVAGDDEDDPDSAQAADYATGKLEHELIDLFGQSHSAWLRTDGGKWFLPHPDGMVYLEPTEHGRYDLNWFTDGRHGTIQDDMEIGYAMAAGDEYVARVPIWQLDREADWRKSAARVARWERTARNKASIALD